MVYLRRNPNLANQVQLRVGFSHIDITRCLRPVDHCLDLWFSEMLSFIRDLRDLGFAYIMANMYGYLYDPYNVHL